MPAAIEMRSDCSRCAALCCIAYPSDDMPGFSASKAAGQPCPHLDSCGQCQIYDTRAQDGFAGCIQFECFGAGQHVVQHLFGGRDWRSDPTMLPQMVETFLAMRPVSDLLYLAEYAQTRSAPEHQAELTELQARLRDIAQTREGLNDAAAIARTERALRTLFQTITR